MQMCISGYFDLWWLVAESKAQEDPTTCQTSVLCIRNSLSDSLMQKEDLVRRKTNRCNMYVRMSWNVDRRSFCACHFPSKRFSFNADKRFISGVSSPSFYNHHVLQILKINRIDRFNSPSLSRLLEWKNCIKKFFNQRARFTAEVIYILITLFNKLQKCSNAWKQQTFN